MAVVIYRRLQRVGFQAAIFACKRTCNKFPEQHGRNCVSATAPTCFEKANQKRLGNHESSFATCNNKVTDRVNGMEVHSFDNDYSKDIKWNLNHQQPPGTRERESPVVPKNVFYNDIEALNAILDNRVFQQHRPEYKVMCYNSECLMKITLEEGKAIMEQVTVSLAPSEVSKCLVKLSYLPKEKLAEIKSTAKFQTLCSLSTSNLCFYTTCELIGCLGAFVRLGILPKHPMLKAYEQEFCLRVQELSTNELLLAADTFRYMGCRVPRFLDAMYSCMQLHCEDLNLPQVIQLVYIIGEGRRGPQDLLKKINYMLFKYLNDINLEEISTVCLGFYKTGNGLSRHVLLQFAEIVDANIEEMSDLSLVNFLKIFRFTQVHHMPMFRRVGQEAYKRFPEMGIRSITSIVHTFSSMCIDEDLMDAVALVMADRVSSCESKYLARLLWSFGNLRFTPPNADVFYSTFINQIRKKLKGFEEFPEHFLSCLMGLAFCQQFPFDLINIALSDKFLMQSPKTSHLKLKQYIFTIARAVEIECPQYTGNTISPEFRKEVTDILVEQSTQDIHTRREMIIAGKLLQQVLGGPEYVKEHMILPHVKSKDLEVHLVVDRKPIAISSLFKEHDQPVVKPCNSHITTNFLNQLSNAPKQRVGSLMNSMIENPESLNSVSNLSVTTSPEENREKLAAKSEVIKLAMQVTNYKNYLYGSQQLLGLHAMKRRHLCKLGYVVVEVPPWEWVPLVKYGIRSQQLDYLYNKVFSAG